MTVAYLDTSAAAKRLIDEPQSVAFGAWADRPEITLVGTHLLETELRRLAHRAHLPQSAASAVLDRISIYDLPKQVFSEAGVLLPELALRSLDALHLAGALQLGVDVMVTYDGRLAEAADRVGLEVVAPT
ncbi:type II toxin-antitoxin system VapC family toxin [Nocardioides panacihumi]|uniref:Ribonuclease VapC n=1 Tax=Nocardioides panacihumi TaxID=400774 RepID=A0ABP5BYP5_9ACTN